VVLRVVMYNLVLTLAALRSSFASQGAAERSFSQINTEYCKIHGKRSSGGCDITVYSTLARAAR